MTTITKRRTVTDAGSRAVKFFASLKHSTGDYAGQPFNLMPWQQDIIERLFGTLRPDGTRQYRVCYVEIPRKNGKTEMGAGVALYLLAADNEPGAQIYSAAGDRQQASLIYHAAVPMIQQSSPLSRRCKVIESQKRVVNYSTASFYQVLSAEAYSKFGINAHGILFDELFVQPNRELWDALTTSTGARTQPLTFVMTTAGYDRNSIGWEIHDYACKVRDGIVDDPTFLPVIYSAPEEADWTDEDVWRACNPALGAFRSLDEMRTLCKRAQETPALEMTFRRLYLNQWCVTFSTMIAMADGSMKSAKDVRNGDSVIAFDEQTQQLAVSRVVTVRDNGTQPIYRITTKRGRTLEVTGNHPFWVRHGRPDSAKYGWRECSNLRQGDRIGVALGWPTNGRYSALNPDEVHFIGIMTGDGTCSTPSVRLTSIDPGVIGFCRTFVKSIGIKLIQAKDHPAHFRIGREGKNEGAKANPIHALLTRYGIKGCTAYDKRVADIVFRGGHSAWARFLSGYLDTDGCVTNRSVVWVSANRDLLSDCQQLLAMLGVQSNLKEGRKSGFLSWRLEVHQAESLDILSECLSLAHQGKAEKLKKLAGLVRRTGTAARDRLRFDVITSVEVVPDQPTIGIEVDEYHSHVTNGLITHNTNSTKRWLPMEAWDKCSGEMPDLSGRECYAGLDLSSTTDLTALALVFPVDGEYYWLCSFWIPGDTAAEAERRDRVPYRQWAKQGLIHLTPGNVVDYAYIRQTIRELRERYDVRELAFDRWGASKLIQDLEEDGFTGEPKESGPKLVPFGQGFASMSPPTKELMALTLQKKIHHGGNAVLRWNADNLVVATDPAGNLKPDKAKATQKIDGMVAGIMALDRAIKHEGSGASVYEERGLASI